VSAIEYISKVALLLRLPRIRLAFAGRATEHTRIVLRGRSSSRACVLCRGGVTTPFTLIGQHG
jgi:hypothetical protein